MAKNPSEGRGAVPGQSAFDEPEESSPAYVSVPAATPPVSLEDIAAAIADEAAARDDAIATAVADAIATAVADAIAAQAAVVPSPFIFGVPAAAPANGNLAANQISFWSNDALNLLGFKMKNSAGVVKTGTVALT